VLFFKIYFHYYRDCIIVLDTLLFRINYCNQIMSRVSTNSMTPFCGACKKAGKKPQEYNSHWTNTKGILTCPFILSSECGYCHQLGHWTKSCPKLTNRTGAGGGGRNSGSGSGSGGWSFSKKSTNKYSVSDDSSNKKHASASNQKNLFSNLLEDSDTESESDDEVESTPVPIKVAAHWYEKPNGRMDWAAECSDSDDE
jgi:hypothetical protein